MTTDTTVIQPGVGQSILTTDHHDRHHGHHDHGHHGRWFDAVESRADFRSLTNEVERFGTQNLASAARTNEIVQAGNCRTDSLVQAGFGDTSDRICASTKDVTGALGTGFTANALAFCKTDDAIAEAKLATAVGFKDAIIASNVGFSAATVQASAIGAAAQLEAAKNAAALSVEATRNANLLSVEATKNFYALSLEATKNAAAAELRAQQIAAAAAAQAAECCCELKELIRAENGATRTLITDNRMRDLEGRLNRIPVGVAITIPPGL